MPYATDYQMQNIPAAAYAQFGVFQSAPQPSEPDLQPTTSKSFLADWATSLANTIIPRRLRKTAPNPSDDDSMINYALDEVAAFIEPSIASASSVSLASSLMSFDYMSDVDASEVIIVEDMRSKLQQKKAAKHRLWKRKQREIGKAERARLHSSPTVEKASYSLSRLGRVVRPPRKKGPGYIDPHHDPYTQSRLQGIRAHLTLYTNPRSAFYGQWVAASLHAAITLERGIYCARVLRRLSRQYIADESLLPENPYGNWNETMLVNEDLSQELNLHLQECHNQKEGITADMVRDFLSRPDIMAKHGISKKISLSTARRYLKIMGYRFSHSPSGQYVDGHERPDVVYHRDKVYIPALADLRVRMQAYDQDGNEISNERIDQLEALVAAGRRVVIWYHDESIFYAHDRRRRAWYHKDASIKPKKKGDGVSQMVADFVCADFGWMIGPRTKRRARRLLKPGKNRQGYFTNDEVLEQVRSS